MSRVKNLLVAVFAIGIIVSLASTTANAQALKIGFVRDDRIQAEYKPLQAALDQWNVEKKAWEDEANAKNDELQSLIEDYDKQRLILSDEKRKEKEAEIRAKQEALDAYTKQVFGPGGTGERKQAELMQPIYDTLNSAIEAVAVEGNYDVIFTMQSGLGYIKETYDVTDKVLEYLGKTE